MAGENKQINELTTRTFNGDSLVPFDLPNTDPSTQAQKPYVTGKCNGHDVADFVANTEEFTTDLNTENKKITGAINELHSSIGANTYNTSSTYNKGDIVIYQGTLYACKDNSVTGTWDASHWDDTTLQPKTDNTLSTTDKTVVGAINELKSGKLDKSKLHYGTGTNFDNNGVCTINITSWGLSARPDNVLATGCWSDNAIITYDRTNSTSTSLKFFCYDTSSGARRTGTNPFAYLVIA